jgi:hypothetical protein
MLQRQTLNCGESQIDKIFNRFYYDYHAQIHAIPRSIDGCVSYETVQNSLPKNEYVTKQLPTDMHDLKYSKPHIKTNNYQS